MCGVRRPIPSMQSFDFFRINVITNLSEMKIFLQMKLLRTIFFKLSNDCKPPTNSIDFRYQKRRKPVREICSEKGCLLHFEDHPIFGTGGGYSRAMPALVPALACNMTSRCTIVQPVASLRTLSAPLYCGLGVLLPPASSSSSLFPRLGTVRRTIAARSQSSNDKSFADAARDAVSGKPGLESEKIDADLRQRTENAILTRGGRVTVGDVAATAGITLFQAESTLKALAADSLATLSVSNDGEILYCFPSGFRESIRNKSVLLRAEPVIEKFTQGGAYVLRVLYGTALITSIVTVTLALMALASASSRDERGNNRSSGVSMNFLVRGPFFDLSDLFFYYDPFYYQRRREMMYGSRYPPAMSFVEAVFSFVFGDGDPNMFYERQKWEAVGTFIQSRGGVVSAEELAPFLDVRADQIAGVNRRGGRESSVVDESYVLPALTRFGGNPEVDANGNILYRFPSLQRTATTTTTTTTASTSWFNRGSPRPQTVSTAEMEPALESRWEMTAAKGGQLFGVLALGAANLVGVLWLSTALAASPMNVVALVRNGLGWVIGAMPFLQVYAGSFFLIPAVRWVLNQRRNAAIATRNEAKIMAQNRLERPTQEMLQKMANAAVLAQQEVITLTERDAVYRSDRSVEQQPTDIEGETWERRLERRAQEKEMRERGGSGTAVPQRGPLQQRQRIESFPLRDTVE